MADKRKIDVSLNLYPDDLKDFTLKAGNVGLTIGELLENFIGDLIASSHTRNGSDECDRAQAWFERCWFGMFPEDTFLHYLIELGMLESFIDEVEYTDQLKDELKEEQEAAEPNNEVIEDIEADIAGHEAEIKDIYKEYADGHHEQPPQDFETGKAAVMKWYEDNREYIRGY